MSMPVTVTAADAHLLISHSCIFLFIIKKQCNNLSSCSSSDSSLEALFSTSLHLLDSPIFRNEWRTACHNFRRVRMIQYSPMCHGTSYLMT